MSDAVRWICIRTFGCLAVCTVLALPAWADTSIHISGVSGSFDAGTVVEITGQGFGAKVPALPFLWDDFEGGTAGQPIGAPRIGRYSRTTNSAYSSQGAYSGSLCSHSLLSAATDINGAMGLVSDWIPNVANNAFASMKYRLTSPSGSYTASNIKLLRVNASDPDPTHGYPNFNIGKDRTAANWYGIVNHGLLNQVYFGGFNALPDPQAWTSLSIWDHLGSPNVANGFAGRELNGASGEIHNIVTLYSGYTAGLRSAYFCGYVSYEGVNVDLYLDEVYADTTLARVLVRAPGGGGGIAMQIPQTWGQNSIRILVNPGAYPTGTPLELIAYDADNNASAPFTVTVGENSGGGVDLGPPGLPSTPVVDQ